FLLLVALLLVLLGQCLAEAVEEANHTLLLFLAGDGLLGGPWPGRPDYLYLPWLELEDDPPVCLRVPLDVGVGDVVLRLERGGAVVHRTSSRRKEQRRGGSPGGERSGP